MRFCAVEDCVCVNALPFKCQVEVFSWRCVILKGDSFRVQFLFLLLYPPAARMHWWLAVLAALVLAVHWKLPCFWWMEETDTNGAPCCVINCLNDVLWLRHDKALPWIRGQEEMKWNNIQDVITPSPVCVWSLPEDHRCSRSAICLALAALCHIHTHKDHDRIWPAGQQP